MQTAGSRAAPVGELDPLDRYRRAEGRVFMTGTQALVRLLVEQSRRDQADGARPGVLVSGYQGSPLGVLDLELARHPAVLADHGIVHQPAVNEELAATALLGTQLVAVAGRPRVDRLVGMWYGKAPGLDRASDAIRHANHIGCPPTGGVLAVVGNDAGAKSSTLPGASEASLAALQMPTVFPADSEDVVELGLHGYALSRLSGLWVGCKVATSVADGSQSVTLDRLRHLAPSRPTPVDFDGVPYVHSPDATLAGRSTLALERSLFYARLEIARRYITENGLNRTVVGGPGDHLGLVAAGKTWLDLRQALAVLGLDDGELAKHGIRLIKLGAVYPLDRAGLRQLTAGLDVVVVVEEKRSFVEAQVRDLLYHDPSRPQVLGKTDQDDRVLVPADGELDPDRLAAALAGVLERHHPIPAIGQWRERQRPAGHPGGRSAALPLMVRTPFFCSGCPHNRSVKVPDGALVGGGIGCHGMAVLMKPAQVGRIMGLTQMGGEGAQWVGMAPFTEEPHVFQNLGDGTFFHSGSLAVRAAVASDANITYKILYNSAVAMTGGQAVMGSRTVGDLARLLMAEGVRRVIVTSDDPGRTAATGLPSGTDLWHRDRLIEAQELLAGIEGVTVLIHDQECAAEKRRKRKRRTAPDPPTRIFVNQRICEGCGDCGTKSNCLSVQSVDTEFGHKTHIHQPSCNKDYSCLDGDCPSFLSVTPAPTGRRAGAGRQSSAGRGAAPSTRAGGDLAAGDLSGDDLPAPTLATRAHWTVRFLGVGGTGVVTAAQVLGTAAMIDGLAVRGLDQTGLAQKGGPVISDLVVSTEPVEGANKLTDGGCDLYLGCDLVVAATPGYLVVADRQRTAAVASTTLVPTGDMVGDARATFPDVDRFVDAITERTDRSRSVYLDADRICETLFGGTEFANTFLVGVASQAGLLPMGPEAVERAVERNGVAVATNLQAFRWGRQAVADRASLDAALQRVVASSGPTEPTGRRAGRQRADGGAQANELCRRAGLPDGEELGRLVRHRAADLIAYQDAGYAGRYVDFVGAVHRAETAAVPGHEELTLAVARYLYKLMAYKDEYEVARLALDPEVAEQVRREFGAGARYGAMLHPPILRAVGVKRKIRLQRTAGPTFRTLRVMRKLRGTPFDPFGHAHVRKVERQLVTEYRDLVEQGLAHLTAANHADVVAAASLPDVVRGYEDIKLRSVDEFRRRTTAARAAIVSEPAPGRAAG